VESSEGDVSNDMAGALEDHRASAGGIRGDSATGSIA